MDDLSLVIKYHEHRESETFRVVLWVMVRRLGLNDELDFGAGAYYYADIPEFDKVLDTGSYVSTLPLWLAIVLFLAWGAAMYFLWTRMDRPKRKQNDQSI